MTDGGLGRFDLSENCADKIRVSQYVLVVACMKTGSYSIFSRYVDSKTEELKIKEAVKVKNENADSSYWFGESISIIYYGGSKVEQSTVFMSQNRHDVDISKIVAYEILMN